MRRKKQKLPVAGAVRICKRFALFPIETLDEIAWLETVYVKQTRMEDYDFRPYWCVECFVDKMIYEGFKARITPTKPWLSVVEYMDMVGDVFVGEVIG